MPKALTHRQKNRILFSYYHDKSVKFHIPGIAEKFGISHVTVSNVLNEHYGLVKILGKEGDLAIRMTLEFMELDFSTTTRAYMKKKRDELHNCLIDLRNEALNGSSDKKNPTCDQPDS